MELGQRAHDDLLVKGAVLWAPICLVGGVLIGGPPAIFTAIALAAAPFVFVLARAAAMIFTAASRAERACLVGGIAIIAVASAFIGWAPALEY